MSTYPYIWAYLGNLEAVSPSSDNIWKLQQLWAFCLRGQVHIGFRTMDRDLESTQSDLKRNDLKRGLNLEIKESWLDLTWDMMTPMPCLCSFYVFKCVFFLVCFNLAVITWLIKSDVDWMECFFNEEKTGNNHALRKFFFVWLHSINNSVYLIWYYDNILLE